MISLVIGQAYTLSVSFTDQNGNPYTPTSNGSVTCTNALLFSTTLKMNSPTVMAFTAEAAGQGIIVLENGNYVATEQVVIQPTPVPTAFGTVTVNESTLTP